MSLEKTHLSLKREEPVPVSGTDANGDEVAVQVPPPQTKTDDPQMDCHIMTKLQDSLALGESLTCLIIL